MLNVNIAIDLGNALIKTSNNVCFKTMLETDLDTVHNDYDYKLELNGNTFYIGQGEYQEIENNKAYNDNLLPFLFTAIGASVEATTFAVNLAVGLPVNQFKKKEHREHLEEIIPVLKTIKFKLNGKLKEIIIRKLLICPEAVGAYLSLNNIEEAAVIIDCGGKTTDVCLIDGRPQKPLSIPLGVLDINTKIKKAIEDKYSTHLKLEDMEKILERGYKRLNEETGKLEEQDISFAVAKTKEIYKRIYNEIQMNEYPLKETRVIAVGGGADTIGSILKSKIKHLEIKEDIFLNVKGFKNMLDEKYPVE